MSDNEIRIAIAEACGYEWWQFTDHEGRPIFVRLDYLVIRPLCEQPPANAVRHSSAVQSEREGKGL